MGELTAAFLFFDVPPGGKDGAGKYR